MENKQDSGKSEHVFLQGDHHSKLDCYDIVVKTPEKIEPGSKMEQRYLKYLMRKYSTDK
jgi:hypothetical protein